MSEIRLELIYSNLDDRFSSEVLLRENTELTMREFENLKESWYMGRVLTILKNGKKLHIGKEVVIKDHVEELWKTLTGVTDDQDNNHSSERL